MVQVKTYKSGKVGAQDVDVGPFGDRVLGRTIKEAVLMYEANARQGTHKAKTRAEVSGSTKKLYRQKGTGRARQGSIRAPHHPGGGMAHALEPQDWSYRPPRKVRIGALKSALSLFAKEGRLIVLDSLELSEIKTKGFVATLSTLQAGKKSLVVDNSSNDKLVKSIRNLANHQFLPPEGVNVYDLLRHDHLVVSKDAAKALEARCLR